LPLLKFQPSYIARLTSENTLYPECFHIVFSVMINSYTLYPLTSSQAKFTRVQIKFTIICFSLWRHNLTA